jgi:hypothetical protein
MALMARVFTRDEAERLLPRIAPLLEELRDLKQQHDASEAQVTKLQVRTQGNGHDLDVDLSRARMGQQQAAVEINGTIERVKALGAEVKDIDMGLIDFRGVVQGREVYLCWKLGEDRIAWWHELDSGYATRQPLD